MSPFRKTFLLSTVLSAGVASVSAAQAPQPAGQRACQIDENSGQLGKALLSLSLAQTNQAAQKWPDAATHLRNAVKAAEKPDKKNELGHKLVLGKALSLWLNQPGIGAMPTRGSLGFTTAPDAPIELVSAVDSSFSQVEATNAACESETAPWRAQKPWLTMVNQAIEQINAGNTDTAEALANRSLRLYRRAPYAYMVLASAAQNRGQIARAMQFHQQTIDAASDTTFAEARRQTMLTVGNLAADVADTASGAARAQFARDARTAYDRLIAEAPNSPQATQARAGLTRALLIAGDTAGFKAAYRDQIDNPSKYDYRDILGSAVAAARSQQWADAAALFENVAKLNPYSRDALYNLAVSYHELGQLAASAVDTAKGASKERLAGDARTAFGKMPPVLQRLVALDPGNSDNWLLLARAYNGLATDAKRAKNVAQQRAMNDSVVKYYKRAEELPYNITFTEFTTGETSTRIRGTLEDKRGGAAGGAATSSAGRFRTERTREGKNACRDTQTGNLAAMANCEAAGTPSANNPPLNAEPRTYTLRIEFLDKDGRATGSRDASAGPVKPGDRANFTATLETPGVVGFRYTVVPQP